MSNRLNRRISYGGQQCSLSTAITDLAQQQNVHGGLGPVVDNSITYAVKTGGPDLGGTVHGKDGYVAYYNATVETLKEILSLLTDTPAAHIFPLSSGRDAIDTILRLLPAGSHIIITPADLYPGTRKLLQDKAYSTGLEVDFTDDSSLQNLESLTRENTKLILTEPISNPLGKVSNLAAITEFAKKYGIISAVDNTVPSSIGLINPLTTYGFDLHVESLTKYPSGNTVSAGFIAVHPAQGDLRNRLHNLSKNSRAVLDATKAYQLIQTFTTFVERTQNIFDTTRKVAAFLRHHKRVQKVHYAGLPETNPNHGLAEKQFAGFGGILSFVLQGGTPAAEAFASSARWIKFADSFGGSATLGNLWPLQSGWVRNLPEEERRKLGFIDGFIRIGTGSGQDARDIIGDFKFALRQVEKKVKLPTP